MKIIVNYFCTFLPSFYPTHSKELFKINYAIPETLKSNSKPLMIRGN
jgi:hypothetical protein